MGRPSRTEHGTTRPFTSEHPTTTSNRLTPNHPFFSGCLACRFKLRCNDYPDSGERSY